MARKKKEEVKEVLITLKGCSLYGKRGRLVGVENYRYSDINIVEVEGVRRRINARFCCLVSEKGKQPKNEKRGGK